MRVTVHTLRRMLQGLEVGLLCIKIQIFKKAKVHIYAWAEGCPHIRKNMIFYKINH